MPSARRLSVVAGLWLAISAHISIADMALNPDVHQDTIVQTICTKGYTKSVRPSVIYTNGVKQILMREASIHESHIDDYQLDHIIPLSLGGHPRAKDNLRLQLLDGEFGAKRKDRLEVKMQCLVCSGQVPLKVAQDAIYWDWVATYHQFAKVKCER